MDAITYSWGRDYNTNSRYEYCVYDGDNIVARKGQFPNSTAAKRAGFKAATEIVAQRATKESV